MIEPFKFCGGWLATCVSGRPLDANSDTASSLNSSVYDRRIFVAISAQLRDADQIVGDEVAWGCTREAWVMLGNPAMQITLPSRARTEYLDRSGVHNSLLVLLLMQWAKRLNV